MGMQWLKQGWALFMRAPIPWAGMSALVFIVLMAAGALPYLGGLLVHVLSPFIVAGYFAASRAAGNGELVTFLFLAAGFQQGARGLLWIGAFSLMAMLLVFPLAAWITGGDMALMAEQWQQPHALSPQELRSLMRAALPTLLLGSVLLTPVMMATLFAPGLVHFEAYPPGKALWWSLWACWVNWRPLLLFSLALSVAAVPAFLIPWGLGLLVFVPWALAATYRAYDTVFVRKAAA